MKNYVYCLAVTMVTLLSYSPVSAIELTEFCEQLITLYDGTNHVQENEAIIFYTKKDSLCYRIVLYSQDVDAVPLSSDEYLGETKYDWLTIYLYGQQDSLFHIGRGAKYTAKNQYNDDIIIFDPIKWDIWIKNNLELIGPLTNGMDTITYKKIELLVDTYLPDWSDKYPDGAFYWRDYATQGEYERIQVLKRKMPVLDANDSTIFIVVETMPVFPGGQQALLKYINESFKCPTTVSELAGKIVCEFVVEKDGSISDIHVIHSSEDSLLDKEAIRVVEQMPNWNPGEHKGQPVRVKYNMPIKFRCVVNQ